MYNVDTCKFIEMWSYNVFSNLCISSCNPSSCIFFFINISTSMYPLEGGGREFPQKIKTKKSNYNIIGNRLLNLYPTPPPPENKPIIRSISGKKILHCGIHKRIHLTLKHNTTISEYFVEFTLPTF